MKTTNLSCTGLFAGLLLLQGCISITEEPANAERGAAIGAITGAVIGHQIDHDHGAIFGAAIGAITGASIGRYQDEQEKALEATLARERRAREVEIQRLQDETLKVSLSSDACFDFDRSDIKPAFYRALDKLAEQLVIYDKTILHIIGHTDSIGTPDYNQALSIRRAQAVAQYLSLRGVDTIRLRIEGRGETSPRFPNDTPQNRLLNRRVDVFIKPIIEGDERSALISPA